VLGWVTPDATVKAIARPRWRSGAICTAVSWSPSGCSRRRRCSGLERIQVGNVHEHRRSRRILGIDECTDVGDAEGAEEFLAPR